MKSSIYICLLAVAASAVASADQVNFYDITPNVPLVKNGKVYAVEDVRELEKVGPVYCPEVVYVNGAGKIYSLKNVRAIEAILVKEGYRWGDEREISKAFIPSFVALYRGIWGSAILNPSYFIIRRDGDPEAADQDVFRYLEGKYSPPKVSVLGNRWIIVFCLITECVGSSPVDRLTLSGTVAPFQIRSLAVESVESVILKCPLPR